MIGCIGIAVPNFLLALVSLYFSFVWFGASVGGLFSADMAMQPWSLAKVWDLIKHLPLPALILALGGTAQLIRIMRANLLDELRRPYVVTARAKGLSEARTIIKYPVRAALNPFASNIAYLFPYLVSGSIIVSIVLGLPTVGPLLVKALVAQDMLRTGDWLIPRVGGDLYADKPPVFFWLMAASMAVTGSMRIGFLLPSLLAGLGATVLVYDLLRRVRGREVAFAGGLVLLLTFQFTWQARQAQIDAVLCLLTTLSLYGLLRHLVLGPAPGWYLAGWAAEVPARLWADLAAAGLIPSGAGP
jgi:4-amino-4-deoxy-L-arabinose transferase-like glycosyltransferase